MDSSSVPLIFFCVCCFIIVVPASLLFIFLIIKGRNQAWTGTIVDKIYNERRDSDNNSRMQHFYSLSIKSDDGKNFKIAVDAKKYNEYKIGDRLRKESGKMWPEKIA